MDAHEKILSIISARGPIIPAQIAKELNINQLFSSALLAELVDRGKLKISRVKVGGSPLYFLPGQEERLQDFHQNLPEKEQRVYSLLKEKKVLVDAELEPLQRVALRQIKDYAKPFEMKVNEDSFIIWKWYLLSNEDAETILKQTFNAGEANVAPSEHKLQAKAKTADTLVHPLQQEQPAKIVRQRRQQKPSIQKKPEETSINAGEFHKALLNYFEKNSIKIVESEQVKKNSEFDFILLLPSPVGSLKYYCKAKNKRRCSDLDLSSAYVKGELKKLPVLFLTTGDFTKKAEQMLAMEFKNMVAHKMGVPS